MSISSGHATSGYAVPKSTTTRAVLILAFAVILGTFILHELDANTGGGGPSSGRKAAAPAASTTTVVSTSSTAPARTPAQVAVLVANGTNTNGVAGLLAKKLTPSGYNVLTPGNTTSKFATSQVQYATGFQTEAEAIALIYSLPTASVIPMTTPAPVTEMNNANVLVVVGDDLAATVRTSTTVAGAAGTGAAGATSGAGATGGSGGAAAGGGTTAPSGPLSGSTPAPASGTHSGSLVTTTTTLNR